MIQSGATIKEMVAGLERVYKEAIRFAEISRSNKDIIYCDFVKFKLESLKARIKNRDPIAVTHCLSPNGKIRFTNLSFKPRKKYIRKKVKKEGEK